GSRARRSKAVTEPLGSGHKHRVIRLALCLPRLETRAQTRTSGHSGDAHPVPTLPTKRPTFAFVDAKEEAGGPPSGERLSEAPARAFIRGGIVDDREGAYCR